MSYPTRVLIPAAAWVLVGFAGDAGVGGAGGGIVGAGVGGARWDSEGGRQAGMAGRQAGMQARNPALPHEFVLPIRQHCHVSLLLHRIVHWPAA